MSQRQLTQAMELARMAKWEYDVATDLFSFDDRFFALYGTTTEREAGKHMSSERYIREFVHPDDTARIALELQRIVQEGVPQFVGQVEQRIIRRDGAHRHLLVRYETIKASSGRTITVSGCSQDITEQKQIEEELRVEQQNLKAIFAASPVGMMLLDEQTMIVEANTVLAEMVRRQPCEIENHRVGNGLGCVHSFEDPRGCGHAKACQKCAMRGGITKVLATGGSVHKAELSVSLLIDGQEQRQWLSVSAEPVQLRGRRHVVVAIDDITARKGVEEELRNTARTDKLTGLSNRAELCDHLQKAVLRSGRVSGYHFAVLFLDFDRFKAVNDSFGHEVGDKLLQEIALRLRATVRADDSLSSRRGVDVTARLGGDEFVVLLDGISSPEDATVVAGRMLDTFAQPYQLGEHTVYSTASIGIFTTAVPAVDAQEVLRDADTAMYEAKQAGKGQYVVFDVSMRERTQKRLSLENDLRLAIVNTQLFLMYQPIVSLRTGQIAGFEALVRWNHPVLGMVSPGEFIPIAEDTGLIFAIGEWVLNEACRQFAEWQKTMGLGAPKSVSVNLSRQQLARADLPETIRRVLANTGMSPGCLHLEVTETAVMKDVRSMTEMLRAIKAIGVKLDMDDFGTGHSSLACLHQFPIDVLKIDRSFVANMERSRDLTALVQAVTQLARNLEISVVAEGIETLEQALMLQSLDCEFGQGYLFSKPLRAEQVVSLELRNYDLPGIAA